MDCCCLRVILDYGFRIGIIRSSLFSCGLDLLFSTTMEQIPQYQSRPPHWVPQATRDGDLGYHGFHPPRPRQGEDILDATTIKSGYTEPPFVTVTHCRNRFYQIRSHFVGQGEAWHGLDTWKRASDKDSKDGLESLQDLMEKVLERRAELYAQVE